MDDDATAFEPGYGADAVSEAAALWLARRDRGLTSAERREFAQWQAAEPCHAAELLRLEAAWRGFALARASPKLAHMGCVLNQTTRRRMRRRMAVAWASLGAAAAAAVVCLVWWPQGIPAEASGSETATATYRVLANSARRADLPDGSVAEVRDDSEVQAEFTAGERRVRLVRGEAHFTVKPNIARPFIVSAGGIDVRAVGTAFNVRLDAGRIEVLVTEGKVHVAEPAASTDAPPPLVVAGQRATVERSETRISAVKVEISEADPAEIEQALAWQSTRIVFSRTPLEDAVEAFNRHSAGSSRSRLVLGDPALRSLRWGGTFRASNVEAFVHLLERSAEVRTERRGNEIVLLPAR